MNIAKLGIEPLPERREGNPEIALQFRFNSIDRRLIMCAKSSSTTVAAAIFSESGGLHYQQSKQTESGQRHKHGIFTERRIISTTPL
jgi:hypothetical protein